MSRDELDPLGDELERRRGWRGVIEEYRSYLDLLPDDLEPVTLREGGTPLVLSLTRHGRDAHAADVRAVLGGEYLAPSRVATPLRPRIGCFT